MYVFALGTSLIHKSRPLIQMSRATLIYRQFSADQEKMRAGMASKGEAEPWACRYREFRIRMWYRANTGHLNQESLDDCLIPDRVAGTLSTFWNGIRQLCTRAPVTSNFIVTAKPLGAFLLPASDSPQFICSATKVHLLQTPSYDVSCVICSTENENLAR
jgi:hypothetical protein